MFEHHRTGTSRGSVIIPVISSLLLLGCNPTVKVEAPEKPIEINLNVRIEHNIRVQIDRELEDLFSEDSEVF